MNNMLFKSDLKLITKLDELKNCDVRSLPQFFRCDEKFVRTLRCNQIDLIMDSLPKHPEYKYLSIDSKTHMLFKDFYPNIPSWHCDDFYRTKESRMQPDLENILREAPSLNYMVLIGDSSLTEFLNEDVWLPTGTELLKLNTGKPHYCEYDIKIDKLITENKLTTHFIRPERLYGFGPLCFHRAQGATKNGWRYFIRFTFSNHYEPKNELRYQSQVYTRDNASW